MIFASIIQCFSWNGIGDTHWLVPASWYLSILFALFAVVLGAQQTVLVGDRNREHYQGPLQKLCPPDSHGFVDGRRPSLTLMLAWQGPIMFLSYSLVWYIIGLSTWIIYPVVQKAQWDDDAKVTLSQLLPLLLHADLIRLDFACIWYRSNERLLTVCFLLKGHTLHPLLMVSS